MMTKLGLYAVLRLGTLLHEDKTLGVALFYLGLATLGSATIGMLAAKHLARQVGYSVLVSMGILLAALGLRLDGLTGPVLYYMIVSVLTTTTFFMLTGMTERTRNIKAATPATHAESPPPRHLAYGIKEPSAYDTRDDAGVAIPAAMAFLGLVFVCCALLVIGLPPLPGFIAKFALLSEALAQTPTTAVPASLWVLCGAVLLSGVAGIIAFSRIGMRLFWSVTARTTPRLRVVEAAPVAALVILCLALGIAAEPVARYLDAAGRSLHAPDIYVRVVLSQRDGQRPAGASPP
jgi:multicomponent K+:H+ antiporter subunit D